METLVWIIHTVAALSVIGLVLLQHGKGADMGAAFGSGSAGSLFGATGASNFLSKTTGVLAAIFFLSSLALTYFSGHTRTGGGVMQAVPAATQPAAPIKKDAAIPAPGASTTPTITVTPTPSVAPAPAATETPAPAQPAAADTKAKDIPK